MNTTKITESIVAQVVIADKAFRDVTEHLGSALFPIEYMLGGRADPDDPRWNQPEFVEEFTRHTDLKEVVRLKNALGMSRRAIKEKQAEEIEELLPKIAKAFERAEKYLEGFPQLSRELDRNKVREILEVLEESRSWEGALLEEFNEEADKIIRRISVSGLKKEIKKDTLERPDGTWKEEDSTTVILEGDNIRLYFRLSPDMSDWSKNIVSGTGSTSFLGDDGKWYHFDRRGINDSFNFDETENIKSIIKEQLTRIQDAVGKQSRSTKLPDPFSRWQMTPEDVEERSQQLQRGKSTSLMPSGMGIGYSLSTKRSPYSKPGSRELAEFFGVSKIYVEEFDAD